MWGKNNACKRIDIITRLNNIGMAIVADYLCGMLTEVEFDGLQADVVNLWSLYESKAL